MSMPEASHIIVLHFTYSFKAPAISSKPLPWLFPCSPPLCAAEETAGQKGTRKESCERGQESKKSREGVML